MCESQVQPMAMLLKALVLMDKRKFDDAIQHVRDAVVFTPNDFDLYETLVQAYLMQNKLQEVFPSLVLVFGAIFAPSFIYF